MNPSSDNHIPGGPTPIPTNHQKLKVYSQVYSPVREGNDTGHIPFYIYNIIIIIIRVRYWWYGI